MPASIKHLTDKKLNLNSLLARWQDGLYYTAAVVKCDKANKKCLVCFEDGSEVWVKNGDVHIQLTLDQLNEDEDIVCCICDDGNSEAPNEIILCDVCQQGYHQKCHNPPVDSSKIDESDDNSDHKDWFCATCSYILNQSNRAKLSANAQQPQQPQQSKQTLQQLPPTPKQKPKQSPPQLKAPQPTPSQHKMQPQPRQSVARSTKPTTAPHPPQQKHQPQPQPQQQQINQKATIGPVKSVVSQVQKQAPYYPLSSQVRAVAASSTAVLASMTASSALVVGGTAGRTKQDLVNQSTRAPQRQQRQPTTPSVEPISTPVKHAVRKSSVNFVMPPVRQSALPTATRSILPTSIETAPNPVTKINQNPRPNPMVVVTTSSVPIIPSASISLSPQAQKINPGSKSNDVSSQKQAPSPAASKLATWAVDPHVATLPLIHPTPKLSSSNLEGVNTPSTTSPKSFTLLSAGTESINSNLNLSITSAEAANQKNTNSNHTAETASPTTNNSSGTNSKVNSNNRPLVGDSGSKSTVGQQDSA